LYPRSPTALPGARAPARSLGEILLPAPASSKEGKMRRFVICIAAALGLTFFTVAPASASHANAGGQVFVLHGTKADTAGLNTAPCASNECSVTVTLSNRDYHRFVRFCGSTVETVIVPAGEDDFSVRCEGPSTWRIIVFGTLLDSNFEFTTHAVDVTVEITVTT
jgi:hypothetical protein